jgi:hypothetical protein
VFEARWRAGDAPPSWDYIGTEYLEGVRWDDGRTEVALGTRDTKGRAFCDGEPLPLPDSWRARLDAWSDPIVDLLSPDGLGFRLPGLRPGEVGQLRFAVAWAAVGGPDEAVLAIDHAVDVRPADILQAVDRAD